jgi:hypothetical protein
MSRIWRLAALVCAVVMASVPVAAERTSHQFEGHTFSLQLPPGYVLHPEPASRPGLRAFGFATDLRSDGTRGMIQVSLLDFSHAPAGEMVTLEKFAAAMIGGVQRRRSRWEQTETDVQVAGVHAKRIQWSGATDPGFGRPAVHMRGVMIVGIMKSLGFSLHTQDVVAIADTTLPMCEQALRTFSVALRR